MDIKPQQGRRDYRKKSFIGGKDQVQPDTMENVPAGKRPWMATDPSITQFAKPPDENE